MTPFKNPTGSIHARRRGKPTQSCVPGGLSAPTIQWQTRESRLDCRHEKDGRSGQPSHGRSILSNFMTKHSCSKALRASLKPDGLSSRRNDSTGADAAMNVAGTLASRPAALRTPSAPAPAQRGNMPPLVPHGTSASRIFLKML